MGDSAEILVARAAELIDLSVPGGGLVSLWLERLTPHTQRAYAGDLAAFGRFVGCGPSRAVDGLLQLEQGPANELVLRYRTAMEGRGLAPATVARRLAAIRSMVELGRTLGYCSIEILIGDPKVEKYRDTRGPGEEGVKAMMSALRSAAESPPADPRTHEHQSVRDLALVRLLKALMLRRSSATRLDLADLDLDADPPSAMIYTKGKRDQRRFTLPPGVVESLRAWIAVRGDAPGPLFVRLDRARARDELPRPLDGRTVARIVQGLGERAGVRRRVTPHQLRHHGITTALDRGKTIPEVMALSGHADPKTLMIYADRIKDAAGDVARLLDEE